MKLPRTHDEVKIGFSQEGLTRLRAGLVKAGLDPRFFAWPPDTDPDRPPYRGLRALEAEDAGIFFGRNAPILEALDRLRGLREAAPPRLLVILGASGAGKSSFMRAGLLPRLARDDRHFLPLPIVRPGRADVMGELRFDCRAGSRVRGRGKWRGGYSTSGKGEAGSLGQGNCWRFSWIKTVEESADTDAKANAADSGSRHRSGRRDLRRRDQGQTRRRSWHCCAKS